MQNNQTSPNVNMIITLVLRTDIVDKIHWLCYNKLKMILIFLLVFTYFSGVSQYDDTGWAPHISIQSCPDFFL